MFEPNGLFHLKLANLDTLHTLTKMITLKVAIKDLSLKLKQFSS